MGIKGIYDIIHKRVPECRRPTFLAEWKGKKWAFDSNALMYRYLYGGQPNSHLFQFAALVCDLVEFEITGFFVFDGKPPKEKKAVKEQRDKRKRDHAEKVLSLQSDIKKMKTNAGVAPDLSIHVSPAKRGICSREDENAIKHQESNLSGLERQSISVTPEQIGEVKTLLRLMGQVVLEAESEGEAWCAMLNRLGYVDAGVTEDSDFIAFGGKTMIRGMGGMGTTPEGRKTREIKMTVYDVPSILKGLDVDEEEFVEASILCGNPSSSQH